MKVLKFAGAFLGFTAFIFLLVIGYNWKEFTNVFENEAGLAEGQEFIEKTFSLGGMIEFIKENPQYTSVYSLPLNDTTPRLAIEETVPRTLGMLGSAFITLHYIDGKNSGKYTGLELISIDSVSAYQVPNIYRTAHEQTLKWLNDNNDIQNGKTTLNDLVDVLVFYNSLAVYDFLMHYFGHEALLQTAQKYGYTDPLYLMTFSGLSIQLNPYLYSGGFEHRLDSLKSLSQLDLAANVFNSTHAYIHNSNFRKKVLDTFKEHESGITFLQEKHSFDIYTQVNPKMLVQMIKNALKSQQLSASSKKEFLTILDWPMKDRAVSYQFGYYGGIFENRMSISSGLDIAFSKDGKDTLVQTVIFDKVPIALWFHMSSKYINLDYQRRIVWDDELRARSN